MALERDDLGEAITDSGLLTIIETNMPAPLTREGLDELFFICAWIDDPNRTDGVTIEIDTDSNGEVTDGYFFVHSFDILDASILGKEFLPLVMKVWTSEFAGASYVEDPEEGDPYHVLPIGTDYTDPGPANAIVQEVFASLKLREAFQASLAQSALIGAGPQMLRDYCQAVLANLSASSSD